MTMYAITATGVAIDTEVHLTDTKEKAWLIMDEISQDFGIPLNDDNKVYEGCYTGYCDRAKCYVEIQMHECEVK